MQISSQFPPNYEEIAREFPNCEDAEAVFSYGGVIYNPFGRHITTDLIEHEAVHFIQQGKDPKKWWKKYINDRQFRLDQEIQAYATQYAFVRKNVKDRELVFWCLNQCVKAISSPLYGDLIDPSVARKEIVEYADQVKFK